MDELNNKLREYFKTNSKLSLKLGELSIDKSSIGQGGNSLVFKGVLLENEVALKFFTNEKQNKSKLDRFKAEYLNIVLLNNNYSIVKLLCYDEVAINDEVYPLIVMKKYEKSLKTYFQEIKDIDSKLEIFLKLFEFLKRVLKNIHSEGIIHRDIKPENILVLQNEFYLTDFGIAYYNPDFFSFKAHTQKGEKLANYDFSAPEQSKKGNLPSESMDIYALGQMLQWFITGSTHKGTKRVKLADFYPELTLYDEIIEISLSQLPENRFQNITEIENFIAQKSKQTLLPWNPVEHTHSIVKKFRRVLAKTFPKLLKSSFTIFDDTKINTLFENLSSENFENSLCFFDRNYFDYKCVHIKKDCKGTWLLGPCNVEMKEFDLVQGYIDYDYSEREFILVHLKPSETFGLEQSESTYEQVYLVDDKFYITEAEERTGYAEIDGEIIELKNHQMEMRSRYLIPTILLIATEFHNAFQWRNLPIIEESLETLYKTNGYFHIEHEKKIDDIKTLVNNLAKNLHPHFTD